MKPPSLFLNLLCNTAHPAKDWGKLYTRMRLFVDYINKDEYVTYQLPPKNFNAVWQYPATTQCLMFLWSDSMKKIDYHPSLKRPGQCISARTSNEGDQD